MNNIGEEHEDFRKKKHKWIFSIEQDVYDHFL